MFFSIGSTVSYTAIPFFLNSGFVYLHSLPLSLHLPKGIYSNFAPLSESDTDYFIVGVYLGTGLGRYGSCWTLVGIKRLRAER